MYVVRFGVPRDCSSIHLIGGCSEQQPPGTVTEEKGEWSAPFSTLREARDFALLVGRRHSGECRTCKEHADYGF
jgi:hypothetical protein